MVPICNKICRFFLFAEDDKVAPADFVEEQLGRLIVDGIDASGHRFAPMPTIQKPEEENGQMSATIQGTELAQWFEEYERRRKMESHVTNFLKHPDVYTSKLAHFLVDRCGVDLLPAGASSSDLWRLSREGRVEAEHEVVRSNLDWWEGGKVGGTVRVNGVGTTFPRAVPSPTLWPQATQEVAGDCTATFASPAQSCHAEWGQCRL